MNPLEQLLTGALKALEKILGAGFDILEMLIRGTPKKKEKYDADFMKQGAILSRRYKGFCFGLKNLSKSDSHKGAIIFGGSGSGKTSSVIIPSALTMLDSSLIFNDVSGEIFQKVSGYLKQQGFEIRLLNFGSPEQSDGYNSFARIDSSSSSIIKRNSHTIVQNKLGEGKQDQFWNTQAESLISLHSAILIEQEPQYRNYANVYHLLNAMNAQPKAVDTLFSRTNNEALYNEYRSIISYDDKLLSNIIATSKAALSIFQDQSVARTTSINTINMMDFKRRKIALFLQTPVTEYSYYAPIVSLFFEELFSVLMSELPKDDDLDVFCLIDEAPVLKIPSLQMAMANVRKYRCGIMLVVQDYNQLIHNFGRYQAEAIRSNSFAKLYHPGQPYEVAKELQNVMGMHEFEDDQKHRRIMPIMSSDQIRTMPSDHALLMAGHYKPIYLKLRPYYKTILHKYTKIPAPHLQGNVPDIVPLLPLPEANKDDEKKDTQTELVAVS